MKRIIYLAAYFLLIAGMLSAQAETAKKPKVEAVFVLDTTSSMTSLIAAAKDKIWAIASTLATAKPAPDISLGLVAYRDKGDTYITRFSSLTPDIDKVYSDLMDFQAQGGGDSPESVNQALYEAVHNFQWDTDADTYRVIFLVGDCPPHMDYRDDVKYPDTCRVAAEMGIIINTVQMGNYSDTIPIWQEIARSTSGEYFRIDGTSVHTHYDTPYDKEIAELSTKHDATRVYYGDVGALAKNEERVAAAAKIETEADDSVVAQRALYNLTESGKSNFIGTNELVDKVARGEVRLGDIKGEELPPAMQTMTKEEQQSYIDERINLRKGYEEKLLTLNSQRQEYIKNAAKANAAKEEGSFENQVYKSLQKQGAEKNIKIEDGLAY
jgi:Mg-chelatase subunit ChlD